MAVPLVSRESLYTAAYLAVRPSPLERIPACFAPLERIWTCFTAGDEQVLAGPANTDLFRPPETDLYLNGLSRFR